MKIKYISEAYFKDVTVKKRSNSKEEVMQKVSEIAKKKLNIERVKSFLHKNYPRWSPTHMLNNMADWATTEMRRNVEFDHFKGATKLIEHGNTELSEIFYDRIVYLKPALSPHKYNNYHIKPTAEIGDEFIQINIYYVLAFTHPPIYHETAGTDYYDMLRASMQEYSNITLVDLIKRVKEQQKQRYKKPITNWESRKIIGYNAFLSKLLSWLEKTNINLDYGFKNPKDSRFLLDLALTKEEQKSLSLDAELLKQAIEKHYDVPVHVTYCLYISPTYSIFHNGFELITDIKSTIYDKKIIPIAVA